MRDSKRNTKKNKNAKAPAAETPQITTPKRRTLFALKAEEKGKAGKRVCGYCHRPGHETSKCWDNPANPDNIVNACTASQAKAGDKSSIAFGNVAKAVVEDEGINTESVAEYCHTLTIVHNTDACESKKVEEPCCIGKPKPARLYSQAVQADCTATRYDRLYSLDVQQRLGS